MIDQYLFYEILCKKNFEKQTNQESVYQNNETILELTVQWWTYCELHIVVETNIQNAKRNLIEFYARSRVMLQQSSPFMFLFNGGFHGYSHHCIFYAKAILYKISTGSNPPPPFFLSNAFSWTFFKEQILVYWKIWFLGIRVLQLV